MTTLSVNYARTTSTIDPIFLDHVIGVAFWMIKAVTTRRELFRKPRRRYATARDTGIPCE